MKIMKSVMKIMEKKIMKVIMTTKIMMMGVKIMYVRIMILKNAMSVRTVRKYMSKSVNMAVMRR